MLEGFMDPIAKWFNNICEGGSKMLVLGMVDGVIVDIDANVVPLEDRGHQFGDGVYEVTRVYHGQPFALKEHLERLKRSLDGLRIPLPFTLSEIRDFHDRIIQEAEADEAAVYMQVTRGVAPRIHYFPDNITPRLTMTIRPIRALAAELRDHGAKAVMVPDERWLRCNIKSLNLLGNTVAKQAAQEKGCFEAIMVRDTQVTEGSSSNVFVVKDNILYTHPANHLILPGITRNMVIEYAKEEGLPLQEESVTPEFLLQSDEAFLSGTTTEIIPIVRVDDSIIGEGAVGPITRLIQRKYKERIDNECGR
jgi:D-alanine transaminase